MSDRSDDPVVLLHGRIAAQQRPRLARYLTTAWEVCDWLPGEGEGKLRAALERATAMVSVRFDATFPPAPRLRLLQIPAAGYDAVDRRLLPPGAALANVFEHEGPIAEFVLAGMLAWSTRLIAIDAEFRGGSWASSFSQMGPPHLELAGKHLGIVGAGHIGEAVALRARPFGLSVSAVTRTPGRPARGFDRIDGVEGLDALMAESDFVLVACPLTPQTRGMIGAAQIARMKPDAVIVNVGRGPIIDEETLYEALAARRIGGAILDVWWQGPTPDHQDIRPSKYPYHALPNVIMTPHRAGWTDEMLERRWQVIADNLDRLVSGRPLRNLVEAP